MKSSKHIKARRAMANVAGRAERGSPLGNITGSTINARLILGIKNVNIKNTNVSCYGISFRSFGRQYRQVLIFLV